MRNLIELLVSANIAIFTIISIAPTASADVIDDNVIKAQRSVENAQKRLEKALDCQANRAICLKDMTEKLERAAKRANDKLAAIKAVTAE